MVRVVGVEGLAGDEALARHRLLVRNVVHLRITGDVLLALVVLEQFAPDLGRGEELRWREGLVADHQHMMIDKSAVERPPGLAVDAAIEVETADFGAGMRSERADRVGHRFFPAFFPAGGHYGEAARRLATANGGHSSASATALSCQWRNRKRETASMTR
jgi:hypothetical protein